MPRRVEKCNAISSRARALGSAEAEIPVLMMMFDIQINYVEIDIADFNLRFEIAEKCSKLYSN